MLGWGLVHYFGAEVCSEGFYDLLDVAGAECFVELLLWRNRSKRRGKRHLRTLYTSLQFTPSQHIHNILSLLQCVRYSFHFVLIILLLTSGSSLIRHRSSQKLLRVISSL